jgi:hypothetical protein
MNTDELYIYAQFRCKTNFQMFILHWGIKLSEVVIMVPHLLPHSRIKIAPKLLSGISIGLTLLCFFPSTAGAIAAITQKTQTQFGAYEPSSKDFVPGVAPYKVPDSLKGVLFTDKYSFSDDARAKLMANGFVAVPSKTNRILDIYQQTCDQNLPVFVTTDALLHSFHIIYDNMLRIAEHERFFFQLDTMLTAMLSSAAELRAYNGNDSLKTAITRSIALLDVAHTLLSGSITFTQDAAIRAMVAAETTLIAKHSGFAASSVVIDIQEDFSQYAPRGHYTRDERFTKYFKAMMYLGRMNLRVTNRMETMQAVILTRLLETSSIGSVTASGLWERIYDPTVFFVGKSDDLCFRDYTSSLDRVIDSQWVKGDMGLIYSKLQAIQTDLKNLPHPRITSGLTNEQGFRVMGQRFVPDAYILNNVALDTVNSCSLPRGLDVLAVLGSQHAKQTLLEFYHNDKIEGYASRLDTLTSEFAALPPLQWAENLYWNWLYTLTPLFTETKNGYPFFMTTPAWADKTLVTALGSWVELRHDSILYAKQSYITTGITCQSFMTAQGYVEPNPEVFGRLASLAKFMTNGFQSLGFSSILPLAKLDDLATTCIDFQDIAIKELVNDNIGVQQYHEITGIGNTLKKLEDFSSYQIPPISQPAQSPDADTTMAIIADIHTNVDEGCVLEEGVGKPMNVFVVVPVEGRLQICRGALYSYYEFAHPMNDRLTDEKWQGMLVQQTAPPQPAWTQTFSIDAAQNDYSKPRESSTTPSLSASVSVGNTFRSGDSVIALVTSDSIPSVTVESGDKIPQVFLGASLGTNSYRIAIPPDAIADSSAILTFQTYVLYFCDGPSGEIPMSYRKLIVRDGPVAIINKAIDFASVSVPRVRGNRVQLPPATAWRVLTVQGKQIAAIALGTREWIAPKWLTQTPLLLLPQGNKSSRPIRLLMIR